MKNVLLLAILLLHTVFSFAQTPNLHQPNQVIIGFSDNSTQAERQEIIDQLGTAVGGITFMPSGSSTIEDEVLIKVAGYPVVVGSYMYSDEIDLISNIQGQHAKVDQADLNYILTTEQYSFDAFMGNANMASFSPISSTCEASYPGGPLESGSEFAEATIKVGILDTGLDPYYPTINQYVAGEANVLADDFNPEIGVLISYGYNPANPIALDDNGHGTAVAGIIAGLSDRVDLSSTHVELYIIKCFDEYGNSSMYNLLQAIRVASIFDLDVLNLSWSYLPVEEDETATALEDALYSFGHNDNGIIVAGSGNDNVDLNTTPYAPASLQNINNLITVGGVTGEDYQCNGYLAKFSNYGGPVEIAAPSASISVPGLNGYWAINTSGTSFATPIVTAAVIQSWLAHNSLVENPIGTGSTHPICEIVVNSATWVSDLANYDIEGAVNFAAACHPGGVLHLQSPDDQDVPSDIGLGSKAAQVPGNADEILRVAPNPFTNQLVVSFDTTHEDLPANVELFNMQGAKVTGLDVESLSSGTMNIQVPTELPSGPYLLRVRQNGEISAKVVIKG